MMTLTDTISALFTASPLAEGLLAALLGGWLVMRTYPGARTPALIVYVLAIVHGLLLWNALGMVSPVAVLLSRCVIPAAAALLLLLFMGDTPVWASLFPIGAYVLLSWLSGACSNALLPLLAGMCCLPLLLPVYRVALAQFTMDVQSRDMLGDSRVVQELYARGYRPSAYYQGQRRRSRAQYQLQLHGVHTAE